MTDVLINLYKYVVNMRCWMTRGSATLNDVDIEDK
jgi:hypothetical protein